jgi:spoIIIJ-associated protein
MNEETVGHGSALVVETTGETVGEAKWQALRELERLHPGLARERVRFQVLSEGERGLLGVGTSPARVLATVDAVEDDLAGDAENEAAGEAREVVDTIARALGVGCRTEVHEDDDSITVSCSGGDLGILIGKHGQTIDAVQYLVNAISFRREGAPGKSIVVDAAGYRARREATLGSLAVRHAEEAVRAGEAVELEPMTAAERRIVHLRLRSFPGVETASEGQEPNRYVVIRPAAG